MGTGAGDDLLSLFRDFVLAEIANNPNPSFKKIKSSFRNFVESEVRCVFHSAHNNNAKHDHFLETLRGCTSVEQLEALPAVVSKERVMSWFTRFLRDELSTLRAQVKVRILTGLSFLGL